MAISPTVRINVSGARGQRGFTGADSIEIGQILGRPPFATDMGTSPGAILSDNGTAKDWFEEIETGLESVIDASQKIDTFDDLATITPVYVDVGDYLRCVSIGAVYQRVPDNSTTAAFDYTGSGGCKWIYIPSGSGWDVRAFGMSKVATDNSASLENVLRSISNYYEIPSAANVLHQLPVVDFGGGEYTYEHQVNLGTNNLYEIILRGGKHYASTSASWGATDVIFRGGSWNQFHQMVIDPQRMCGGLSLTSRCRVHQCEIYNFGWVGLWLPNEVGRYSGNCTITETMVGKYHAGSPEYVTGAEWPEEPAVLLDGVDALISDCHFRWSNPCVKISANGGFHKITNCHLFSQWFSAATPPRAIVMERGAFASTLDSCYLDAAYCDVYTDNLDFLNCVFMANDAFTANAICHIRAFPPTNGVGVSTFQVKNPRRWRGTKPFVQYVNDPVSGYSWAAHFAGALNTFMASADGNIAFLDHSGDYIKWANGNNSLGDHIFASQNSRCQLRFLDRDNMGSPSTSPSVESRGPGFYISNNGDRLRVGSDGGVRFQNFTTNDPTSGTVAAGMAYDWENSSLRIQGASGNTGLILGRFGTEGTAAIFRYAGAGVGNISVTASATAYNTSSDYRIKTVEAAPNGYDPSAIITQLAEAQDWFTFNVDPGNTLQLGWLAHKLQVIEPRAVTGEKDAVENIGTLTFAGGEAQEGVTEPAELPDGASWVQTGTQQILQGRDDSKLIPVIVAALAKMQERIAALENAHG